MKWCKRHHYNPKLLAQHMARRRVERRIRERVWKPQTWKEADRLAKALTATASWDDLCTCEEAAEGGTGTPSWLCRVSMCYATAVGARCEERTFPQRQCDCMGWEADEPPGAWNRLANGRVETHWDEYGSFPWWFEPPPPTPTAGWPEWEPQDSFSDRALMRDLARTCT